MRTKSPTARGKSLAAFDGRCILDPAQRGCRVRGPGAGGVVLPSSIPDILGHPHPIAVGNARRGLRHRAVPARRLARLGATPDFRHVLLRPIAAAALVCALSAPVAAQWIKYADKGVPRLADGTPNLSAPTPRTAEGRPDLSGIWRAGRTGDYGYDYNVAQELKPQDVQPWAEALRLQRVQDFRKDSPLARCLPVSVPFLNFRGLSRIVQTPGLIVMLYESPNSPHRTIFTDGRELPKELNPTWLGYSIGRWEQDTLVVTTAGFNDRGWLDVGGHPQTESLRITERFRRRDFGHMELDMTFDDPKTFARPFTLRTEKTFAADTELLEDVCENERSNEHLSGGVKLAPDVLSKYAGIYEVAGREVVVAVAGDQLLIRDSANPSDSLFVARSETQFLSSLSQVAIEFVRDSQGAVTHFIRTGAGKDGTAVRKGGAAQSPK